MVIYGVCNSQGFNDQMMMNRSISLEMWMQCGPSHVKCGSTTSPHFECGCNVEQCGCIVEQCGFPHFKCE